MIDQFFWWCVGVLQYIGTERVWDIILKYCYLRNIVPALILLFFILWRIESKNRNK